MLKESYVNHVYSSFSQKLNELSAPLPAVSLIALENNDPYRILVSTILSLRTKDDVTLESSLRVLKIAPNIYDLDKLPITTLEEAAYPSGFYKRKAKELKEIAKIIISEWDGIIPDDLEKLMTLPGVGIKTASLVLNLGFNKDALCVDCHVHEITNRLGWVNTKTPEETEKELRLILPEKYWITLNELLVRYGQYVCTPISPFCTKCPENEHCPKKGVKKYR